MSAPGDVRDPRPILRRHPGLALGAVAALIYLVLGATLMRSAIFGHDVVSPAAFWAQNGPFPTAQRNSVPDGVNLLSDNVSQFTPWLRYAAARYAEDGTIPLWKSLALCGAPLLGNGQSALFFPTNLVAILLGAPAWFGTAQSLFKLVAGALGAWALARHLRLRFLGALLVGLVFGFGGYQVVFLQHPHTLVSMLLPLLLLATDRLVLAPSPRRVAFVAVVAALQHLGGHAETAYHCQLAALALGVCRAWSLRAAPGGPGAVRRVALLVAGLCLGALLAAVQILPLLEYIAQSDALRLRELRLAIAPPVDLASAAGLFVAVGIAAACALWLARDRVRGRLWIAGVGMTLATFAGLLAGLGGGLSPTWIALVSPDWFGSANTVLGPVNYVELNGAFAGAALPLALFGLLAGRVAPEPHAPGDPRRGVAGAAAVLLLLGLLALFHAPGLGSLLALVPGLRLAENARLSLLALLATAVLAGIGLDALGRRPARPDTRLRLALLLGALVLGGWGALAFGVTDGRIARTNTPDGADDFELHALPLAELQEQLAPQVLEPLMSAITHAPETMKVFTGWFVDPAGSGPEGAPDEGPSITGARLLYTRGKHSVEALVVPALQNGDAATPWLTFDGRAIRLFVTMVPAREFPPEVSSVRLRLSLSDGRALTSTTMESPDDPGRTALPFPARPMPGPAVAQLVLLLLATLALLVLIDARGALRAGGRALLVVLCGASLLPFVSGMLPLLPRWAWYPPAGALDMLAEMGPDARLFSMVPGDMPAEIPVAYGLSDVRGYDALHPLHSMQLLRRATDRKPWIASAEALPTRDDIDLRLLGVMGVRCIANWTDAPEELQRIPFRDQVQLPPWAPFRLVRNPHFLSRARLVTGRVVEPDDRRALDLLASPDFPHATTAVLAEGAPTEASAQPPGSARLETDRPDLVRVEVQPAEPCTLLLADTFFPGWKATVDGVERPIVRADVAFRAVALQPGDRVVEFRYEPLPFRIGVALSTLGAVLLLALLLVARRGVRRGVRHGRRADG